jgi:hypothetical protein
MGRLQSVRQTSDFSFLASRYSFEIDKSKIGNDLRLSKEGKRRTPEFNGLFELPELREVVTRRDWTSRQIPF